MTTLCSVGPHACRGVRIPVAGSCDETAGPIEVAVRLRVPSRSVSDMAGLPCQLKSVGEQQHR